MASAHLSVRAVVLPVALLALAELAAWLSGQKSYTLAPPSRVFTAAVTGVVDGSVPSALLQTLASVAGGFAIGAVVGVSLGVIFGLNRPADHLSELTVEAFRAMPPIAVLPIWMIIYGLGYRMEIAIIAFTTAWPNLVMTRAAVRGVTPRLLEVSRVLGLSLTQQIWKIVLPAALPRIFVALRLTLGFSLIIAVTVEIVGNPQGLGSAIMFARDSSNPDQMLAFLVAIGLLGLALNALMRAVEQRMFGRYSVVS